MYHSFSSQTAGLAGDNTTYIGFTDIAEEGVYVWGDNTPMDFEK